MRSGIISAVLLAIAVLSAAITGCSRDDTVSVTGSVNVDEYLIHVPQFQSGLSSSIAASIYSGTCVRIESVEATVGQRVTAGQTLLHLDSALLDARVAVAEAGLHVAKAQVGVLEAALEDAELRAAEIEDARSEIEDRITQATAQRSQLILQLAEIEVLLGSLSATGVSTPATPSATPPPSDVPTDVPSLPDRTELETAAARLRTGVAEVDDGLARARSGLVELDNAESQLAEAHSRLTHLRTSALAGVESARIEVSSAEYLRSLAVVRAPVDGVLIGIADPGDVLVPGATAAVVRENAPVMVTTWLSADEIVRVQVGDAVLVSGDWMVNDPDSGAESTWADDVQAEGIAGTVAWVGTLAEYPPTSFATDEIHMTRAFPVEITIENPAAGSYSENLMLPPGVPVDIVITPSGS